jgi:ribosomal protein L37AE/L43A
MNALITTLSVIGCGLLSLVIRIAFGVVRNKTIKSRYKLITYAERKRDAIEHEYDEEMEYDETEYQIIDPTRCNSCGSTAMRTEGHNRWRCEYCGTIKEPKRVVCL